MPGCPSDEVIFQFAQGALAGAEHDAAERHVHACAACRRVVADTAKFLHGHAATTVGNGPAALATLEKGDVIDRYVVDELLGRGAMGVVYAAHDPKLQR